MLSVGLIVYWLVGWFACLLACLLGYLFVSSVVLVHCCLSGIVGKGSFPFLVFRWGSLNDVWTKQQLLNF